MDKIALLLITYGMDFHYEHRGSNGEIIRALEIGVIISKQKGKIHFDFQKLEDNENSVQLILSELKEIINEHTSSQP